MQFSHITRQAQYNHPCLTSCYLYTTSDRAKPIPVPNHTQFTPHSALVPANPYLLEEIPGWLLIYVNGKIQDLLAFLLGQRQWPIIIDQLDFFVSFILKPIHQLITN